MYQQRRAWEDLAWPTWGRRANKTAGPPVRLSMMRAEGRAMLRAAQSYFYRRHSLLVRITHWINVVALIALLMSGLQIFNEHPALYWGKSSYTGKPALFEVPRRIPVGKVFRNGQARAL